MTTLAFLKNVEAAALRALEQQRMIALSLCARTMRYDVHFLVAVAAAFGQAQAQLPQATPSEVSDLTAAQADSIGRRLPVFRHWPVKGAPWPRVRLYQFVDATPEQCAAMLSDYELQKTYLRDLTSRIVARPTPTRTKVAFHYKVRWWPDVDYTVTDELHRVEADGYAISWTLDESRSVSVAEGSARFVPWLNPVTRTQGTLFTYEHFVVPTNWLARLVPDRVALGKAWEAAHGIAGQVERERKQFPDQLERQLVVLRTVLSP